MAAKQLIFGDDARRQLLAGVEQLSAAVKATLGGIRPAIVGLILATATTMFLSIIFSIKTVSSAPVFDYKALIIFGIVLLVPFIYKKLVKKSLSPILLIIFSGIIGVLMYGV